MHRRGGNLENLCLSPRFVGAIQGCFSEHSRVPGADKVGSADFLKNHRIVFGLRFDVSTATTTVGTSSDGRFHPV